MQDLPPDVRRRLVSREPVAMRAFFESYFPRVYAYVRRLVADEHLAEDLTQDVFLHVHRGFDAYDPERPLRPWVFTIATNKLRDHWRSRRHQESHQLESLDAGLELAPDPGVRRADQVLEESEAAGRVRGAIDELPEGLRITLVLRAFEQLSFEEIGAIVERSPVAVRKRYSRALEALRGILDPAAEEH